MSNYYHVTVTQGRADTLLLEATSSSDIKSLFSALSTVVVTNIKKIVFSKKLNINYVSKSFLNEPFYHTVLVFVKTQNYADVIRLFNVRKTVTDSDILSNVKQLTVNGENILDIYNIQYINER